MISEVDILKQLELDLNTYIGIHNVEIFWEEVKTTITKTYLNEFQTSEESKTGKWVILADWKCYMQNWVGVNSKEKYKVNPSTSVQVTQLLLRASRELTELTGNWTELILTKRKV